MKINVYKTNGFNSGQLIKIDEIIDIKPRRWIEDRNGTSHPMKFIEPIAFENKNVYFLYLFGDNSGKTKMGKHISLSFWENQKFLFMQKLHWVQKEENIRYIVNIIFLIIGACIAYKSI